MGWTTDFYGAPRIKSQPIPQILEVRLIGIPDNGVVLVNQGQQQQEGLRLVRPHVHGGEEEYIG